MIKTTKLPEEFIGKATGLTYAFGHMGKPEVEKITLEGIDEIQYFLLYHFKIFSITLLLFNY